MALKEILNTLKVFVGDIVNNFTPSTKAEFEDQLEKIRLELSYGIEDTQKEYRRLAHKFYEIHKPFGSGNTEKDLAEYRHLIVHALSAGDIALFSFSNQQDLSTLDDGDKCLLDNWGVVFPYTNPSVLAEGSLEYYAQVFSFLTEDQEWQYFSRKYNLPDGARLYYEYLAKKMAIALGASASAQNAP